MWADEELAIMIAIANVVSAIWSYFCITSSIDRTASTYDLMHEEVAWYALWYSCQTFALLVSVTNVILVTYVAYRLRDAFFECIQATSTKLRRTLLGVVGTAMLLLLLPASFVPYKLTLIQTSRMDENVFINWDV